MQSPVMRTVTPEPIDTTIVFTGESLNHGNQNFIPKEEKDAFLSAPKTPVKERKPLVCPGAPARKKAPF